MGEFLEGPTLLEYLRGLEGVDEGVPQEELDRLRFRPEVFAHNVLHNFMADAFEHGLFHADLHPGNLILLRGKLAYVVMNKYPYSNGHLMVVPMRHEKDFDALVADWQEALI